MADSEDLDSFRLPSDVCSILRWAAHPVVRFFTSSGLDADRLSPPVFSRIFLTPLVEALSHTPVAHFSMLRARLGLSSHAENGSVRPERERRLLFVSAYGCQYLLLVPPAGLLVRIRFVVLSLFSAHHALQRSRLICTRAGWHAIGLSTLRG